MYPTGNPQIKLKQANVLLKQNPRLFWTFLIPL